MLLPLANILVFSALLTMVGVVTLQRVVLVREPPGGESGGSGLGALAGTLLVVGLGGAFAAQLVAFNFPPDPLLPDARLLLSQPWGRAWTAQVALALTATACFTLQRSRRRALLDAALVLCVIFLAFTPAFVGHAASAEPRALAVAVDGVHVLAAGAWLGTLAALALTTPLRGDRGDGAALARRLRRFSPVALTCAALVAATGLASAWMRLVHPSDLWQSPYGRMLSLKVLLFLGVGAMGWFNWKRGTPRLAESGDPGAVRATIAAELVLALAVVAATAFLLTSPLPEH